MVWSFLWRFVAYSLVMAYSLTFIIGFFGKIFGVDTLTLYTVGGVVQVLGIAVCAVSAYLDARFRREQRAARAVRVI